MWLSFTPEPEYFFHAIILFFFDMANRYFSNFIKISRCSFFFNSTEDDMSSVVNIAIRKNICCSNQAPQDEGELHAIT